jgi:hypothetical protein
LLFVSLSEKIDSGRPPKIIIAHKFYKKYTTIEH